MSEQTTEDVTEADREAAQETIKAALAQIQDATFEDLFDKPRRKTAFLVTLPTKDGGQRQVRIRYQAMDPKAFDDLLAAHPPTPKEERKGAQWNADTFPAALVSAVSLAPKMTFEQAKSLLDNPRWAPGEVNALFRNALDVCTAGLNVPFSDGD